MFESCVDLMWSSAKVVAVRPNKQRARTVFILAFFTSRSRACTLEERPLTGFELWDISLTPLFSGVGERKSNKLNRLGCEKFALHSVL